MTARRWDSEAETGKVGYAEAIDLAQEFLGDLGIVVTSDPSHARVSRDLFIIKFKTAAQALEAKTMVTVDRSTGGTKFVTLQSGQPDPWPDAEPAGD